MFDGLEQGDLVRASWLDSGMARSNGWETAESVRADLETNDDLLMVDTIGYYLGELRPGTLLIAQSRDRVNDQYLNFQMIHVPCITSVEKLSAAG